ncbi:hypothetical protein [Saccharothrix syringae]|uniref:Uncharacterized protein n=1 Tax=Saccharothrix syringae TaxID=103733 RepID=A0A5Q0H790_SACSY|nr:hypothetical protein [Saccharothrix syringae]QFZ22071.1 hypothetical protein EKG83_35860 [Saccharothrix syringae]
MIAIATTRTEVPAVDSPDVETSASKAFPVRTSTAKAPEAKAPEAKAPAAKAPAVGALTTAAARSLGHLAAFLGHLAAAAAAVLLLGGDAGH